MNASAPPIIEQLQTSLAGSPFQQLFRLQVIDVDRKHQTVTIRLSFTPVVERKAGTRQYHGGVIAALVDIAGDYALIATLNHGVPTINLRVDYLRPAVGTDLIARAQVRRAGRTIGVVDIDVEDEDSRLVAVGRGCYGTQAG